MQWQVLNMAVRQKQKEQVLLVENYYHELAISCISENLGQENIYLEELEILKIWIWIALQGVCHT